MSEFACIDDLVRAIHDKTASNGQRFSFGVTGGGAQSPCTRTRCASPLTNCCRLHGTLSPDGAARSIHHRPGVHLHVHFPAIFNALPLAHPFSQVRDRVDIRLYRPPHRQYSPNQVFRIGRDRRLSCARCTGTERTSAHVPNVRYVPIGLLARRVRCRRHRFSRVEDVEEGRPPPVRVLSRLRSRCFRVFDAA